MSQTRVAYPKNARVDQHLNININIMKQLIILTDWRRKTLLSHQVMQKKKSYDKNPIFLWQNSQQLEKNGNSLTW